MTETPEPAARESLESLIHAARLPAEEAAAILAAADAYAANEVVAAIEIGRRTGLLADPDDDGRWLTIAFLGHLEYTGFVTEITKNGQPAYRIDLPEKIWGGNPLAYVTHAASSWFSDRPVTEESVRKAWEAQRERAARRAREEAEWQERRAIEDGDGDDDGPAF